MTDIAQRLLDQITVNDHARGCAGRCYSCECGYDRSTEALMAEAAAEIERLREALNEVIRIDRLNVLVNGTFIRADDGMLARIARAALTSTDGNSI